jgi:hypothetical protein
VRTLELPYLRADIEEAARILTDKTLHQLYWRNGLHSAATQFDEFDYVFHVFFDDFPVLSEDPHSAVGVLLCSDTEAELVQKLVDPLDRLLSKYGPLMTPQQGVCDPLWPKVVQLAEQLHKLFLTEAFIAPPLKAPE